MDNVFMNSENRKTSGIYGLLFRLADEINLRRSNEYVALLNLSMYCLWINIKKSQKKKFKKSAPTRNEKFDLPDGSYFVSDIQDY